MAIREMKNTQSGKATNIQPSKRPQQYLKYLLITSQEEEI